MQRSLPRLQERKRCLMMYPIRKPPPLTLDSTVAYRQDDTGYYFERCCLRDMQGKPVSATLREVAPLDPGCRGCGVTYLLIAGGTYLATDSLQKNTGRESPHRLKISQNAPLLLVFPARGHSPRLCPSYE